MLGTSFLDNLENTLIAIMTSEIRSINTGMISGANHILTSGGKDN